jgi:hypothetical protein
MGQLKSADFRKSSDANEPADVGSDDFAELVQDFWKHRMGSIIYETF